MISCQMVGNESFRVFNFGKTKFTLIKGFLSFEFGKLFLVRFSCHVVLISDVKQKLIEFEEDFLAELTLVFTT